MRIRGTLLFLSWMCLKEHLEVGFRTICSGLRHRNAAGHWKSSTPGLADKMQWLNCESDRLFFFSLPWGWDMMGELQGLMTPNPLWQTQQTGKAEPCHNKCQDPGSEAGLKPCKQQHGGSEWHFVFYLEELGRPETSQNLSWPTVCCSCKVNQSFLSKHF